MTQAGLAAPITLAITKQWGHLIHQQQLSSIISGETASAGCYGGVLLLALCAGCFCGRRMSLM